MPYTGTDSQGSHLREVAGLFFRLGLVAFGGPAAHIAMMHDEIVERRKWIDEQEFLDLMGATNLIPGPNSTELVIHLSYKRAGLPGLIIGGVLFILPAMVIVTALAWVYVTFGSLPVVGELTTAQLLLYGIQPVIVVIVLNAIIGLSKKALKGPLTGVVGAAVIGLFFGLPLLLPGVGNTALILMLAGGLVVMLLMNLGRADSDGEAAALAIPFIGAGGLSLTVPAVVASAAAPVSLWLLFLTFLKIGSVLYGSGYALLAFLQDEFVRNLGWLTTEQVIDAVAVGQFTPGPLFSTATFIGYLIGGLPGAILATIGISLPAFVLVFLSAPYIPRLRESRWLGAFLDGINVAALGLMAAVTIQLAQAALTHPVSGRLDVIPALIGAAAAVLLLRFKVNTTWLILGGAAIGAVALLFF